MNPLVTVTIVTHNSGRFIRKCLDSVFRQRYSPAEIIVVDNASTDGTAEMLAGYSPPLRLIRNTANAGFAAAQNLAIRAGRGEWVLTLNPDVILEPDFLESLLKSLW